MLSLTDVHGLHCSVCNVREAVCFRRMERGKFIHTDSLHSNRFSSVICYSFVQSFIVNQKATLRVKTFAIFGYGLNYHFVDDQLQ